MLAKHRDLEAWGESWGARKTPVRPLLIRLHLKRGSPLVSYDPVQLDNLLAFAVVQEATQGNLIGNPPEGCVGWCIPLPMACAWLSPDGLPLWESTVFWPVPSEGTTACGDVLYWHKRMPRGIWSAGNERTGRLSLNGSTGRWMERRTPVPVTLCDTWEARCVGDIAEVRRLLESIAFVGKKRSVGLGEVEAWEVEESQERVVESPQDSTAALRSVIVRDGVLQRPLPVGAAEPLGIAPTEAPTLVGWTPPQWNPKLFGYGWQPGTRTTEG